MNGGSNGSANLTTTLCSNSQDDLKSGSNNTLGRHHDPYRFTRSTQQPVDTKISDYPKYRSVNSIFFFLILRKYLQILFLIYREISKLKTLQFYRSLNVIDPINDISFSCERYIV